MKLKWSRATGETQRFDQLMVEYEKAPRITRKRLYLDAKEKLYSNTNKVIVAVENGKNMFYMPIDSMHKNGDQNAGSPGLNSIAKIEKAAQTDARKPVHASTIRSSRSRL